MQILTAFVLGLLTILDPCTLMTSITAISYIDKEINNRRKVLTNGGMFVLGKLATYILLSVPFLMGAQTEGIQHVLAHWGEPVLAAFMLICGIVLLFSGHHHHNHDHGVSKFLQNADSDASWLWSFILGIFFAIAFCPHRLVYFLTMIDITLTLPGSWNWLMPVVFGLGTGLPIMLIAWLVSYSAVSIGSLTNKLQNFEKWFRHICAILFIGLGVYLAVHCVMEAHEHGDGGCCHHHTELTK
ncbi:MAG: sulfite exporter TauE/SafE family protein [Paludibacteraceae bacterium]|nr:sulfite exporter TauE/SafE family protein [Paludibacteraceae bacterium]